ncbi:MAG TPA: AAA domain-containing protein [Actinophytocola sp.]|uniref:AAA domain-containing protein n=1 Tax=Actinophytocola sp. TaxID=1872138 RepID=UPI002F95A944
MTETHQGANQVADPSVGRAVRLFEFLGRTQQLRNLPPRTVDGYRDVLWLDELPEHPAVTVAHRGEPGPDDPILTIDRVARVDPPVPEFGVDRFDDPGNVAPPPEDPELRARYDEWLPGWQEWAAAERRDRPVRAWYGQLFATYVAATGNPEELELVVGVGCLAWRPPDHPEVRRHVVTAPVTITLDDDTGQLAVRRVESVDAADVELDMLDPGRIPNPRHVNDIRAQARELAGHPLDRTEAGALVRRVVHMLDAGGEYRDGGAVPMPAAHAVASFAPAVILRRRSQQGLVEIFSTIVDQLTESGEVPDGLRPLVDPDHRPAPRAPGPVAGALVKVDDDEFLPLPVNDTQLRIIRQVDTQAQTLVQGPPGTGKTHTAAALLSHLLAQGKRVLVTAHTDRALREVRDKLPAAIKPLSVAVVGTSREDMSDLKVAVERIAAAATDHDEAAAAKTIEACLDDIERLRVRRADLHDRLIEARADEVREHSHAGYQGTLAAIARALEARRGRFGWLPEHADVRADEPPPVTAAELAGWRGLLLDRTLSADELEAGGRLVDLTTVPPPPGFADLVTAENAAAAADEQHDLEKAHLAFEAVRRIDAGAREQLRRRLRELADEADDLARRRETWMNDALADVRSGRGRVWHGRAQQLGALAAQAEQLAARLGPLTTVEVDGNVTLLVPVAQQLHAHLAGGALKTGADGLPKLGPLTPRPVKQAQALFAQVRVDGLPPVNAVQVAAFLVWADLVKVLAALDRAWPAGVAVASGSVHERVAWHGTELDQLRRVLRLSEALETEQRALADAGLPRPDWTDLDAVRTYARLVDVAAAADAHAAATVPLRRIEATLSVAAGHADAAPCVRALREAARQRDPDAYAVAHKRLERLHEVRRLINRRDAVAERVPARLRTAVETTAADPAWDDRLASFGEAWSWAAAGAWVLDQGAADVNALQAEIGLTEQRIRARVEELAATRAWGHAVSPDRLTGQARANLEHYAYLVRRLGKGTGRYAAQRRVEVRQAMDRCRPAVPVWIMPVYRIAEQLRIRPDMFDVVIVDEASQAGLEATFLQYLAPRMVVIGDDKQVSPSAVGVDQQQLRDLAGQYLADDPYRSAWQDPQRSLFDEAKMRYRGLLTLTEHRRCVPEIIAFSNRVAYEPDGIRLVPVRQYGADRLEPIRPVYLPDGHVVGTTNKINPVEVEAVVEQLEKCVADPRYDGMTFGVISLLGSAQAKAIERRLLERIAPEDWAARRIQCGDSADFQGAERDVMFLSMVAAGPSQVPLTRELFVQRYNVAASRARDQMWLFHSIPPGSLDNAEDMRFQLLDHCYGVVSSPSDVFLRLPAPADTLVEPFGSLFTQHVANELVSLGYSVVPRYTVDSVVLDLVVVGARSRLAIVCEGDEWRGAAAYERDLARQRDLERCGWRLFRIRASAFYVSPAAVLERLVAVLRALEIEPRAHH